MNVPGIFQAYKKDITVWTAADIGVTEDLVGLDASPTNVFRSFTPEPKGKGKMIEGDTPAELVTGLLSELKAKHLV